MSIDKPTPAASGPSFFRRLAIRLFGRWARPTAAPEPHIAELDDDLRADLGLPERRLGRVEDFWSQRRQSAGRDLPL